VTSTLGSKKTLQLLLEANEMGLYCVTLANYQQRTTSVIIMLKIIFSTSTMLTKWRGWLTAIWYASKHKVGEENSCYLGDTGING